MCVQIAHQLLQFCSRILPICRILLPPRPEKCERPGVRMSASAVRRRVSPGREVDNGGSGCRDVGKDRGAVGGIQNEDLCPAGRRQADRSGTAVIVFPFFGSSETFRTGDEGDTAQDSPHTRPERKSKAIVAAHHLLSFNFSSSRTVLAPWKTFQTSSWRSSKVSDSRSDSGGRGLSVIRSMSNTMEPHGPASSVCKS